jgi:hypothetical protein
MDHLDEKIVDLLSVASLESEFCALYHGYGEPEYYAEAILRKDFHATQLRIPVCGACIEKLQNNDWFLCYCVFCCSSQWIYKPPSKMEYIKTSFVIWLDKCPKCYWEGRK